MWDTHFHNNRRSFKESVFNSHLHQTGHTGETALKEYVVPSDKSEVLNTYLQELDKLQQSSGGDEIIVDFGVANTPQAAQSKSTPTRSPRNCTPTSKRITSNCTTRTEMNPGHSTTPQPNLAKVARVKPTIQKARQEEASSSGECCIIL